MDIYMKKIPLYFYIEAASVPLRQNVLDGNLIS